MVLRSTFIVDNPLVLRSQRVAAGRQSATGRDILTLPLLAGRLAGGFIAPVSTDVLYPAIQGALAGGGFKDIASVAQLPGMPRAVLRALDAAWRADIDLALLPQNFSRLADLCLIEERVRESSACSAVAPAGSSGCRDETCRPREDPSGAGDARGARVRRSDLAPAVERTLGIG